MSNSIKIGGMTLHFENGSSINVSNGKVIVDGKQIFKTEMLQPIEVVVNGDVNYLNTENGVTVNGSVLGDVEAGNGVECGDVHGDVKAGNSIHCKTVKGNAKAGNSIYGLK